MFASALELLLLVSLTLTGDLIGEPFQHVSFSAGVKTIGIALTLLTFFAVYVAAMAPIQFLARKRMSPTSGQPAKFWSDVRLAAGRGGLALGLIAGMMLLRELVGDILLLGLALLAIVGPAFDRWSYPPERRKMNAQSSHDDRDAAPQLRRLLDFAAKMGLHDIRIRFMPFDGAELAVCDDVHGLPSVLISDRLPKELNEAELQAVLAHELGHHSMTHSRTRGRIHVVYWCVMMSVVFWIARMFDSPLSDPGQAIVALPLAGTCLWLTMTAFNTVLLAILRWQERRAIAWALDATRAPGAYASAMSKLAALTGRTRRSTWFGKLTFETHPCLEDVLRQVRDYAKGRGIPFEEPLMQRPDDPRHK